MKIWLALEAMNCEGENVTAQQINLFENVPNDPKPKKEDEFLKQTEEISALDEMFAASRRYRSSREYMDMLKFISRFPKYSPFNCLLLHTQNPAISYVATAGTWARKFGRHPKRDARPLVILAPMSPVLFVYDLKDTEGEPVPHQLARPFKTQGKLPKEVYEKTLHNCGIHGIGVREVMLRHRHAGSAIRLNRGMCKQYKDLKLEPWMRYLILLNKHYTLEDKYSSLAHEMAHIFCGHVGVDDEAWWPNRPNLEHNQIEIEAESVAYLVCRRKKLFASAERYLSAYDTTEGLDMPLFSVNAVIQATTYIEDMGQSKWEKPKKKSRYRSPRENK
ncbi:MAG: hypothetical protein JRJ42_08575 [Deltaproteobacteria bacterium]|nr:hypothetical protein [Deltaproteobacteria bacterium]